MNKQEMKEYQRYYYQNVTKANPEKLKKHRDAARVYERKLRLAVMHMIAKGEVIQCHSCGCNFYPILEINHKSGGGTYETVKRGITGFYSDIVKGKRSVDDLEITCKICNALHFINLKYPDEAKQFKIEWRQKGSARI
jgi:hypothetical protein